MGQAKSKEIQARIHAGSSQNLRLPNHFALNYNSSWKKIILQLGETKDHPLYSFALPQGWYGEMVMYNGPDPETAAPVAAANTPKITVQHAITIAPPRPGAPVVQEEMRSRAKGPMGAYSFAVAVANGELPEKFEWISSSSDEVKALGEFKKGWKLVRAGHVSGGEVFAVWAEASASLHRAARFEFVGRGQTDELGELWRLMAVVTAARLWQLSMQISINAAIA